MNENELSNLLQQAKAQSPKPGPQFAASVLQGYRERFARPSFLRRHRRLATAAAVLVVVVGIVATGPSTGSPLPPEYRRRDMIGSGRMVSRDGWTLEFQPVVRPFRPGLQVATSALGSITEARNGGPIVFHRYLGDGWTKVYFGYDIVLNTNGMSGKLTFRPLSVQPDEMPAGLQAAGVRIVAVQELPTKAFETGQNVAVTLATHPVTGQQVIDYIRVDTSYLDLLGHIIGNFGTAIHRHFEAHRRAVTDGQ